MSKVLDTWPSPRNHAVSRNRKYPWEDWLDGRIHKLKSGKDFHCKLLSFRMTISRECIKRNVKYRSYTPNGKDLVLQALIEEVT